MNESAVRSPVEQSGRAVADVDEVKPPVEEVDEADPVLRDRDVDQQRAAAEELVCRPEQVILLVGDHPGREVDVRQRPGARVDDHVRDREREDDDHHDIDHAAAPAPAGGPQPRSDEQQRHPEQRAEQQRYGVQRSCSR